MTSGNFQTESFRSFFIRNASGNGDVTIYGYGFTKQQSVD